MYKLIINVFKDKDQFNLEVNRKFVAYRKTMGTSEAYSKARAEVNPFQYTQIVSSKYPFEDKKTIAEHIVGHIHFKLG